MKIQINKLKELMLKSGMTYTALSLKSGVSKTHISRIVSGHTEMIRFDTILKLSKALNVNPDYIVEKDGD